MIDGLRIAEKILKAHDSRIAHQQLGRGRAVLAQFGQIVGTLTAAAGMISGNLPFMKSPVLIVIDMLNDFLDRWEPEPRQRLVQSINELTSLMRSNSHPVIWIRQEFEPDLRDAFPEMKARRIHIAIKGTPGCRIVSNLAIAQQDKVIVKKRYSAFFGTDLDQTLAGLAPDAVILAGINTHACIRTTAIDAYQRDWPVVLAADCIDSYDAEHHEVSLRYMRDKIATLMTNHELRLVLSRVN